MSGSGSGSGLGSGLILLTDASPPPAALRLPPLASGHALFDFGQTISLTGEHWRKRHDRYRSAYESARLRPSHNALLSHLDYETPLLPSGCTSRDPIGSCPICESA